MLKIFACLPEVCRRVLFKIIKMTVHEWRSVLLRRLWQASYGVEIGIGSYGCFHRGAFCSGDRIGNYCSIGANVWHLQANHPMDHGCMSPIFYLKEFAGNLAAVDIPRTKLEIGHDVWIGRDVKILSKVTHIGNGAVIGAGSVVTKNVEPYTVVAGNPAKVIRRRFADETASLLEDSMWWTLEPEQLMKLQDAVNDPKAFAEAAKRLVGNC